MATAVSKKRGKLSPSKNEETPAASTPLISDAKLKQLYSTMLQCRLLDERAQALRGAAGKSASSFGREAATVGAVVGLRRDDWLLPLQDDLHGKFVKGLPLGAIGSELLRSKASPPQPAAFEPTTNHSPFHIGSSAANPAAQLNLASGIALALRAGKTGNIVMAFCGDTSDSGQRWQEALRYAGRQCLPLLVLVHIKASSAKEDASASLLGQGNPCEFPVIPVDASDVVAMYRVAYESIHKARHGGGPTLIQAISLPESAAGQTVSGKDPAAITKMEAYLAAKGLFSPSWKQRLLDKFATEVDLAFASIKSSPLRNSGSSEARRRSK